MAKKKRTKEKSAISPRAKSLIPQESEISTCVESKNMMTKIHFVPQEEYNKVWAENMQLRQEISILRKDNATLQSEISAQNKTIAELYEENKKLRLQIAELTSKIQVIEEKEKKNKDNLFLTCFIYACKDIADQEGRINFPEIYNVKSRTWTRLSKNRNASAHFPLNEYFQQESEKMHHYTVLLSKMRENMSVVEELDVNYENSGTILMNFLIKNVKEYNLDDVSKDAKYDVEKFFS
jgi:septal ring factor EnvC (AmiA/AmiB activator)